MAGRKPLDQWFERVMNDPDKPGKCIAITMHHDQGGRGKEIHSTKLGASTGKPDELARLFKNIAETYSQDLPGIQTFELKAFYEKDGKPVDEALAFHPFTVAGSTDNHGLGSEAPTEAGMTKQAMRWYDADKKSVADQRSQVDRFSLQLLDQQARIIDTLSSRLHDAMHENVESFESLKQLVARKMLDDQEFEMKRIEAERSATREAQLLKMLPLLANTITGKEVFPQSAADTLLIDSIATNLKPHHIETLMKLDLPMELMGPLMQRFNEAHERAEAERKARPLPPANPEDDAAGD